MAYYTVYTSTPKPHRDRIRAVAEEARAAARGVWAKDTTADFALDDQASIGPRGQVILPKLFRRCTDYLADVAKHGYLDDLKDWLVDVSVGSRNEDEGVVLHDAIEVRLSDLVDQRNHHVIVKTDLLDITFVEK